MHQVSTSRESRWSIRRPRAGEATMLLLAGLGVSLVAGFSDAQTPATGTRPGLNRPDSSRRPTMGYRAARFPQAAAQRRYGTNVHPEQGIYRQTSYPAQNYRSASNNRSSQYQGSRIGNSYNQPGSSAVNRPAPNYRSGQTTRRPLSPRPPEEPSRRWKWSSLVPRFLRSDKARAGDQPASWARQGALERPTSKRPNYFRKRPKATGPVDPFASSFGAKPKAKSQSFGSTVRGWFRQ